MLSKIKEGFLLGLGISLAFMVLDIVVRLVIVGLALLMNLGTTSI